MNAPERIWAFTYDNCDFDNADEYLLNVPFWQEKKPVYDATEYVRADLFDALQAENERLRGALTKPLDNGWRAVMDTAIGRFKVAALANGRATWNAVGSQAMAELLTELARYVDRARAINAALTAADATTTTADNASPRTP